MVQLSTNSEKKYYFYNENDKIVYEISSSNTSKDPCGHKYGNGGTVLEEQSIIPNLPYIIVKDENNNQKGYYFQKLMEDGDKVSGNTFAKLVHGDACVHKTYLEYFKDLCINEIKEILRSYPTATFETLRNRIVMVIPAWIIKGNGYTLYKSNEYNTIPSDIQIDLGDEKIVAFREEVITNVAKEAANKAILPYNYEVNELTVKEKE